MGVFHQPSKLLMDIALEIDALSKAYNGVPVLQDLTLHIPAGEIFGLLGPNGAGKSTTINMIAGVTRIGEGQIRVFGYDNQTDFRITRRLIGVMHQEIVTDNFFTIEQALKIHPGYYGARADRRWRETLIERLGLGPHLHKPMNQLSGGLKRRFMVAKALSHQPRLLILDEPTAGVDVELRRALWDFVRDINREGTTVLLTTHYLEEAEQMCNRVGILNHGRLVALDRTRNLLSGLGRGRLLLHLNRPLETIPEQLSAFSPQLINDGTTLQLQLPVAEETSELLSLVAGLQLPLTGLETDQPSLEEAFLQMTGLDGNNGKGKA